MPLFNVKFDGVAFASEDPDADFTEQEAAAFTEASRKDGSLPEGIVAVVEGQISADDGQGDDDIKCFVTVTVTVEAEDENEARYTDAPEELLERVAELMNPDVTIDGGWEVLEVDEVEPAEPTP